MARQYFETCNTTTITLSTSGWTSSSGRYYQKVTNTAIKSTDTPEVSIVYPVDSSYALTEDNKRAIQKAASFLYLLVTANGSAYVYSTQKPAVALTLQLKGVSG